LTNITFDPGSGFWAASTMFPEMDTASTLCALE